MCKYICIYTHLFIYFLDTYIYIHIFVYTFLSFPLCFSGGDVRLEIFQPVDVLQECPQQGWGYTANQPRSSTL